jgi:hypothetical protein
MWLACDLKYTSFPVPVRLNRLAAERFVLIFGMLLLLSEKIANRSKKQDGVKHENSLLRHLCQAAVCQE